MNSPVRKDCLLLYCCLRLLDEIRQSNGIWVETAGEAKRQKQKKKKTKKKK